MVLTYVLRMVSRPTSLFASVVAFGMSVSTVCQPMSWGQLLDGNRVSGVAIRQIEPARSGSNEASGVNGFAQPGMRVQRPNYPVATANGTQSNLSGELPAAYSGAVTGLTIPAYISPTVEVLTPATTTRQAQQEALALIPWNELNVEGRRKIKEVVDNPSLYRRLPVSRIHCDPQFYQFSIRNPETIIGLWQVFGVTSMGLQRTGPYTFSGDDGAGTECTAELVYGDQDKHIYVGTGTYEGPVFRRKLTGRCVVVLKTDMGAGTNQYALTNQLDVFLRVDNLAADLITRTLQPMVGRTADHNFNESLLFLQAFSETAAQEPQRVEHLVQQLQHIEPTTKHQFQQVVSTVQPRQVQYKSQQDSRVDQARVQVIKPQ